MSQGCFGSIAETNPHGLTYYRYSGSDETAKCNTHTYIGEARASLLTLHGMTSRTLVYTGFQMSGRLDFALTLFASETFSSLRPGIDLSLKSDSRP